MYQRHAAEEDLRRIAEEVYADGALIWVGRRWWRYDEEAGWQPIRARWVEGEVIRTLLRAGLPARPKTLRQVMHFLRALATRPEDWRDYTSGRTWEPAGDDRTLDGIPILPAYPYGGIGLKVWCRYCERWHYHGYDPEELLGDHLSHRVAHCCRDDSPYRRTGYYLELRKREA